MNIQCRIFNNLGFCKSLNFFYSFSKRPVRGEVLCGTARYFAFDKSCSKLFSFWQGTPWCEMSVCSHGEKKSVTQFGSFERETRLIFGVFRTNLLFNRCTFNGFVSAIHLIVDLAEIQNLLFHFAFHFKILAIRWVWKVFKFSVENFQWNFGVIQRRILGLDVFYPDLNELLNCDFFSKSAVQAIINNEFKRRY